MFGGFVFGLMTNPSHRYFDFIADKMDTRWYWWEIVLIVRKTVTRTLNTGGP